MGTPTINRSLEVHCLVCDAQVRETYQTQLDIWGPVLESGWKCPNGCSGYQYTTGYFEEWILVDDHTVLIRTGGYNVDTQWFLDTPGHQARPLEHYEVSYYLALATYQRSPGYFPVFVIETLLNQVAKITR